MQGIGALLLKFLPLIFAFGFLVPVIHQGLLALGWQPPLAITTLHFAMIVGGLWGLSASIMGRWI